DSDDYAAVFSQIEFTIKSIERHSPALPLPDSFSTELRLALAQLNQQSPFANSLKLLVWKLSYRLWNACVDISNASSSKASEEHAKLRQAAAELLLLSADVVGIPSPAFKVALFFHKTGLMWYDLRKLDLANNCFEKAADLVSNIDIDSVTDDDERKLLLDLNLARSRLAWDIPDRNLAIALLNRSKNVLCGISRNYSLLANQYLAFGKALLSTSEAPAVNDALKLMNDSLELCEKGLRVVKRTEETLNLKELRLKTLRFIAAAHLQSEDFESVLKCVNVLREVGNCGDNHPSLSVLAMKAWLGLGRFEKAEKELRGMVVNKGIPEGVWVSAVESYFHVAGAAGVETVKGVFFGLLERCQVSAGATIRVVNRIVRNGGEGIQVRAKVVSDLVSDERVLTLFAGKGAAHQRTAMHALLWNCATENFRSKDYHLSAEMFEKSMLFVPLGIENRILKAKGYRVLCLCYLGVAQLDRAEEYVNEAEKLEPNIASAFLKFKIYLQMNDHDRAIAQMQSMHNCLDFTTDFISLSAHEAVACRALPVATASLNHLLTFYSSGKQMSTNEVVVHRVLVTILTQEPGSESQIIKHMKRAHARQAEIGPDLFFGKSEVGRRERNWFAANAWNLGVKSGQDKHYSISAEFFILASEFYGIICDGETTDRNTPMLCKSLLLGVSAKVADEKHGKCTLEESEVRQAIETLGRAGKMLKSNSSAIKKGDDQYAAIEPHFFFLYTWAAFDLYSRLSDTGPQQLQLVKELANFRSLNPKHLLHIGFEASQGPRGNPEVAAFALNTSLSTFLSSSTPDYQTVAEIIRKLISVAAVHRTDPDDDDSSVMEIYKQAYRMMVGLKEGEYPIEEAKWLAMTAWNRAAVPLKLGQIGSALKWMKFGLEIAMKVPSMNNYRSCMEEHLSGIQKKIN
ncbi:hypothetical protein M569_06585, partial [Genlisea aurea]